LCLVCEELRVVGLAMLENFSLMRSIHGFAEPSNLTEAFSEKVELSLGFEVSGMILVVRRLNFLEDLSHASTDRCPSLYFVSLFPFRSKDNRSASDSHGALVMGKIQVIAPRRSKSCHYLLPCEPTFLDLLLHYLLTISIMYES
jgi:hypothetical protein